jgi:hypothetical protein
MTESWRYDQVLTERSFPWPPAEDESPLAAFGETWKQSTFQPGRFFARLPRTGGNGPAVLYYLVIGVLVAGVTLFWETVGGWAGVGEDTVLAPGMDVQPILVFLFSPLILLFALAASAAATHLVLLLVRGALHGFGATVRVFCYAYSPMLFGMVPVVGTFVGMAWMVVVAIVGLGAAHATPGWKPALAVILPLVVLGGIVVMGLLTLLAAGAV